MSSRAQQRDRDHRNRAISVLSNRTASATASSDAGSEARPTVAVVIPTCNEESNIGRCLDSILNTAYPLALLDIVVVDGMSTDRSRSIVERYQAACPSIRMIDNTQVAKSAGLNLGIRDTSSDIIMRVDTHSTYDPSYIPVLVDGLDKYQCDNIGAVRRTARPESGVAARAICAMISHPFAAGRSPWRVGTSSALEVDTVYCGCYRREVFDRVGLFDERLIRTQDRELNQRLIDAGGTIVLTPDTSCTYYPRAEVGAYARWTYDGAYWVFYARSLSQSSRVSLKNMAPLVLLGSHLLMAVSALGGLCCGKQSTAFRKALWLSAMASGTYWVANVIVSIRSGLSQKSPTMAVSMVWAFAITHFAYAIGSLVGLVRGYIRRQPNGS